MPKQDKNIPFFVLRNRIRSNKKHNYSVPATISPYLKEVLSIKANNNHMKILVIEDEKKLAQAIKNALTTQKHIVETVSDGKAGYDLLSIEKFDIIILDVMLPTMDGYEICQKMREDGNNTPVLMLTAKGQVNDRITGLDQGADDYMTKPFSFEELFARIRALTRRPIKTNRPKLSVDRLTLDNAKFRVTQKGEEVTLSAKEFALLEYLLRNKNIVLTKQQIVENVWSWESDVLPSTVEVHIKNLRDKIDTPFNTKTIQTVRGRGYTIEETKHVSKG